MPNEFDSPFSFDERIIDPSGRRRQPPRPRKSRTAAPKVEELVKTAIREVCEQEMRAASVQGLSELLQALIAFFEKRKRKGAGDGN